MKHALRRTAVAAAVVASLLGQADLASAHTVQGTTWFSDGSTHQVVFEGMTVTAYATGAVPGVGYYLVFGRSVPGADLCHSGTRLNPNVQVASSRGFIAQTSGVVPVVDDSEGWEVAFCGTGVRGEPSYTRTQSATLTVYSTTH